ncbi:MAG: CTP synthase (glutamine hydrolyzing) [archaeon]
MHLTNYSGSQTKKQTKFIVVTGGVLSGLGKGIAAASIGHLLKNRLKVVPMKLDGYLNVDPGTMNPIEHGEVFVLDDGGEVDMDFGHYERFLDTICKFEQNLTMGKVFDGVRKKERRGDYLGKTVQFIPHVTDAIKNKLYEVAEKEQADVLLVEIGGTVGDIENELYIESARQMRSEVGDENILYVHLTYVPIPNGVNEPKSKPTQQSINMLRQRGIRPDIIICRCEEKLNDKIKSKIALFCDVDKKAVISGVDVKNVYCIPFSFEEEGLSEIVHRKLRLYSPPNLEEWRQLLNNLDNLENEITVAICGKYTYLADSYASINEALMHCSAHTKTKINLKFVETTDIEEGKISAAEALQGTAGVIIPGGFGSRGLEGKLKVIKHCRENKVPILGICLGLQLMVVEYARNVCGMENANSTENDPGTPYPVVDIMPEQKNITDKGATMRLGAYDAHLQEGSLAHQLYGELLVSERHRHRYEVNPEFHENLKQFGLTLSGLSKDCRLAEFVELKDHPYFIATQAHPELKSKLSKPAPLFFGLIKAALERKKRSTNI